MTCAFRHLTQNAMGRHRPTHMTITNASCRYEIHFVSDKLQPQNMAVRIILERVLKKNA